eukprot:392351-Alexandrium_andersonii.AAC.1
MDRSRSCRPGEQLARRRWGRWAEKAARTDLRAFVPRHASIAFVCHSASFHISGKQHFGRGVSADCRVRNHKHQVVV